MTVGQEEEEEEEEEHGSRDPRLQLTVGQEEEEEERCNHDRTEEERCSRTDHRDNVGCNQTGHFADKQSQNEGDDSD